jgi:hypothetical protein
MTVRVWLFNDCPHLAGSEHATARGHDIDPVLLAASLNLGIR